MRLASLTFAAALVLAGGTASARDARWIGPLVESKDSHIFSPIVLPGTAEEKALRKAGYVQEEYLVDAAGNAWVEKDDGSVAVGKADIPYTTRIVIVRPRDPRKFNGIVQMGFNHPQFAHGNWARLDNLVLRKGEAYAAVMIGGDPGTRKASTEQWPVASPLLFKWYDAKRYAAFNWPSDDLRWDAIGQAASLLRDTSKGGPLAGLKVRRLYVSGWSYLGSIQRSFIEYGFHDRYRRADGGPVIDGYLIGISAGSVNAGHVPLNTSGPGRDRRKDLLPVIDSPVIELTSEMEAITNVNPQRGESDAVKGGHRLYQLGGVSHRDSGVDDQTDPSHDQLEGRHHPGINPEVACTVGYTDVPMRDVAQAALVSLDRWVETGKAPPRAAPMEVQGDGKDYVRDKFGNPVGGIRLAQLDVPLVRYGAAPKDLCGGSEPRRKLSRLPLAEGQLAAAYPGGKAEYLAKFNARLNETVRAGWILPEDAAAQLLRAQKYAAEAFPAGRFKGPRQSSGKIASGALWAAEVPDNWNGTLLLWSRGYSPRKGDPDLAPAAWKADLLAKGYALAASNYGAEGWALAEAVPAQRATVAAFSAIYGKPRRTIGWGQSMGGLVTTALSEQSTPVLNGGIAMCPSIGGALGMMNMGLDGSVAFKTLVDGGVEVVNVPDDMANAKRVQAAIAEAMKSHEGRARVALAGVLGGIPGWTRRDRPEPAPDDYEAQADEIAASFAMGVFMPRGDQERRAGGVFSWNTGIDYAAQLELSGRRDLVAALYRKAGLDLDADLAKLNAAPRIAAKASAVDYMRANYTPNARPVVPLLSVQAVGDGATSPSLQASYIGAASPLNAHQLWLGVAGHCGMGKEVAMSALRYLEARLDSGDWGNDPAGTTVHTPAPMLRPCFRERQCK